MSQLSKKAYIKKRASKTEASHFEGKHFCDCKTRNIRKWLGLKLHGVIQKTKFTCWTKYDPSL